MSTTPKYGFPLPLDTSLIRDFPKVVREQSQRLEAILPAAVTAEATKTVNSVLADYNPLPTGGTEGQVLSITSGTPSWKTPASGLPHSPIVGHVVTHTSVGPRWAPPLPTGGQAGQVLTRTTGDIAVWASPYPAGGQAGDVLTRGQGPTPGWTRPGPTLPEIEAHLDNPTSDLSTAVARIVQNALADAPPTTGGSAGLTGPGRPDQPGTTAGLVTGSEPVGTTYTSTDGAGVGAWVWRKRPTGWQVTDGDTGWRDITALLAHPNMTGGRIQVRRVGAQVVIRLSSLALTGDGNFTADNAWPVGFRVALLDGTRAVVFGLSGQGMGEAPTWGNVQVPGYNTNQTLHTKSAVTPARGNGAVEYITDDTWPTTLPGTPA